MSKDIVDYTVFKKDNTILKTYTASWCGPCSRIKPHLYEYIKDYEKISEEKIEKTYFKEHVNNFIPYFQISKDNGLTWSSIQTSDKDTLYNFINLTLLTNEDF